MVQFHLEQSNRLILRFQKSKALSQLDICSTNMLRIVQAICSAYGYITLGYTESLCCEFKFFSEEDLLPLIQPKGTLWFLVNDN